MPHNLSIEASFRPLESQVSHTIKNSLEKLVIHKKSKSKSEFFDFESFEKSASHLSLVMMPNHKNQVGDIGNWAQNKSFNKHQYFHEQFGILNRIKRDGCGSGLEIFAFLLFLVYLLQVNLWNVVKFLNINPCKEWI